MTHTDLAHLMFPDVVRTVEDCLSDYPPRVLPAEAIVTRYAPSPTGFIHLGALLASYTEMAFAKYTGGVFYLRIEDTDQKRTIPNGIELLINDLRDFKITFDEGPTNQEDSSGEYGPYIQTQRGDIYRVFVKHLIEQGKAYPCFCSEELLAKEKKLQETAKEDIGYRGNWAHCRHLSIDEAYTRILNGESFIVRLRTETTANDKIVHHDLVKGDVVFPQNNLDIVILKSDGFPTYHFAHVIDDTLMHTTHVIRADEWLSSVPIHLQLSDMLGFPRLKYAHIAPLLKREGSSIRKLSKRKDPECAVSYYAKEGLPPEAVMLYLAGICNSNFEDWISEDPSRKIDDFPISFDKISKTGAIFDLEKLMHISKDFIAGLSAEAFYHLALPHLEMYDPEFHRIFTKDPEYTKRVLNIDREKPTPRKDIAQYNQIKEHVWYMYDELFDAPWADTSLVDIDLIREYMIEEMVLDYGDEKWFARLRTYAQKNGYAPNAKDYKKAPNRYGGHVGHICDMLRYVATGKLQSPDLYSILAILGKDRLLKRLSAYQAASTKRCNKEAVS